MAEMPAFEDLIRMEVVHRVAGMDDATVERGRVYASPEGEPLTMDVYRPAAAAPRLPLVLLVHGGPVPKLGAKNMGVFTSYGRMLAASGFAASVFDHRFLSPDRLEDAAGDVASALAHVRDHADELGIDPDRLAFWVFSGGGPFLSLALRGAPPYIRAALAFYAALDIREKPPGSTAAVSDDVRAAFSPAHQVRAEAGRTPPLFVARAGLDHPFLNASIDRFVAEALAANAEIDVMNHPTGRHAFDILDDDERSREIIARAIDFLKARLFDAGAPS
jgi:acetyl esterase/lipase